MAFARGSGAVGPSATACCRDFRNGPGHDYYSYVKDM